MLVNYCDSIGVKLVSKRTLRVQHEIENKKEKGKQKVDLALSCNQSPPPSLAKTSSTYWYMYTEASKLLSGSA